MLQGGGGSRAFQRGGEGFMSAPRVYKGFKGVLGILLVILRGFRGFYRHSRVVPGSWVS